MRPRQGYADQLKLKKVEEAKWEFIKNNGKDMRLSKNKVSHESEIIGRKVSAIRIEDFKTLKEPM